MKKISIGLFITLLLFAETSVFAKEDKDKFQKFSGKIQVGCLLISTNDQLYVDKKNEKTSSLNKNSNFIQKLDPGFILDLNFSFPSGTNLYFGNPAEDAGKAIKFGCSQNLKNKRNFFPCRCCFLSLVYLFGRV